MNNHAAFLLSDRWSFRAGMDDAPLLLGHRGACARATENTREAIELALASGAQGVEIDLRVTHDGVVVLAHDPDFQRIAGAPVRVEDVSYDDAKRAYPSLLTLDEALGLCPEGPIMLDVKPASQARVEAILNDLVRHAAHPGLLIAMQDLWAIALARRMLPERPTLGLIDMEQAEDFAAIGGAWLRLWNHQALIEQAGAARRLGLGVLVVTGHADYPATQGPAALAQVRAACPDAIVIDEPLEALGH